jgi:UrcA family protein
MMKAAFLASAVLALQATAAAATDVGAPPSERVTVADLNLDAPAGLAALDRRIDAAAKRVCATGGTVWLLWERAARQDCVAAAVSDAHSQRDVMLRTRAAARLDIPNAIASRR